MSWWDVIPVVGDIIGGKLAANATRDSAKIQAESAQRALDQQKEMYDLYRSDSAPYRSAGYSSLGAMSNLLGLPDPGMPTAPPPTMQQRRDQAVPAIANGVKSALSSWFGGGQPNDGPGLMANVKAFGATAGQPTDSSYVIAAPDGQTKEVPREELAHWISKGAKVVPRTPVTSNTTSAVQAIAGRLS